MLDKHPEWARYFALGTNVIVVLDGTAYEIADTGAPAAQITPMPFPLVTPLAVTPVPASTSAATPPAQPAATGSASSGLPCALGFLLSSGAVAVFCLYRR
jgi:hypothetical protein